MLHWLGGLIFALPWAELPDWTTVLLGFEQSTYGVVAFAVGATIFGPRLGRWVVGKAAAPVDAADLALPRTYVVLGVISYFAVAPTIGRISGLNFLPAVGSQLVIVGCCLACWQAWHARGRAALLRTLAPTLVIPMVTIVMQGFLGFGVIAISIILFFCAQFFRPRWLLVAGFLVAGYAGLCFYTSYMRDRNMIRASVSGGDSLSKRLEMVSRTTSNIEAFSLTNPDHLVFINSRLNQNTLVGAAVSYLSQPSDYARGETIWDAVLGLVPRVLWPSKPVAAGSGGLVARFTGLTFSEGTSVGIGQVLEFYANYGTPAVIVGFILMGAIIKGLDIASGVFLHTANWRPFTASFLVGMSFLNVIGSLVEISMGAVSSLAVAAIVNHFLTQIGVYRRSRIERLSAVAE
jgi:hypothetical protein